MIEAGLGASMRERLARPGFPGSAVWRPLLVVVTLLAYAPVLSGGFIWDDDQYLTRNSNLGTVQGLARIWSDARATPQYYPLVHTSFWLEHRLWGLEPFGYHLDNVLLHVMGALLLGAVLTRLEVRGAPLAAAFFALHPVQVESVAWITERKNVLSGVFFFAAAFAYLEATRGSRPRPAPVDRRWYYGSLALFVAALLSKSVTVTLPVALAVVLIWRRSRPVKVEWLPLLPFVAVGAVVAAITVVVERDRVGAEGAEWAFSAVDRLVIASHAIWFYLAKLLWPQRLTFVYPRWDVGTTRGLALLWPASLLFAAVALILARGRVGVGPSSAFALFVVLLAPALGFVDFYPMRFSFVADHFQYLACAVPLSVAACALARWVSARDSTPFVRGGRELAMGMLLAVLALSTWSRALVFRDEASVWEDTLAKNPGAWLAQLNLGRLRAEQGRLAEAEPLLVEAARLAPREAQAHVNLGSLRLIQGRTEEAVRELEEGVRLNPRLVEAHYDLGLALEAQGRNAEAGASYRAALALDPGFGLAADRLKALFSPARAVEAGVPTVEPRP